MTSLPRAALARPVVVLAGTVLAGSLAFLFHVAIGIGDTRDHLAFELLSRQRSLHLILEDLSELHRIVEHGARDPESLRFETVRDRVALTRSHLSEIARDGDSTGAGAAAQVHALTNPVLDDLKMWMDDGFQGLPPESPAVLNAMARRTRDASVSIESLVAKAHGEAAAILKREMSNLERFWPILLSIVLQILLFGILLTVYARRAQRLSGALAAAQRRLRDAIESIPLAFILYDRDERLVMWNERFKNIYAGPQEMVVEGASFGALAQAAAFSGRIAGAADDPVAWLAARRAGFRNLSGSLEMSLSSGRIMEVSERRTAEGGTVTIITDITEIRTREAELLRIGGELRERNFQLDVALENMVVGLAMFDENARLVVCNRQYLEIFSLPAALGRQGTELRRIMETSSRIQGLGEAETVRCVETRLAVAAGRSGHEDREHLSGGRIIRRAHSPLPGGGSIGIYEDITARAKAEGKLRAAMEEAELANRSKSEFLANVSHELRTPLNAIIGFSEIIKAQMFGPIESSQYREYASDIHDSGRHLLALINDILDLSKIEAGKFEMLDADVDLADAVDASLRLIRDRASNGEVVVVNDLPDRIPDLVADPRVVKQILLNLLSNAVKFTEAGGTVTIGAASRADGGLEVSVRDTGIGMSADEIALALTPFGQVDSALNRRFEGTGLGLPLTERLIALHGGALEVRSEKGAGTCVTVRFPASRVQPVRIPAQTRRGL